MEDNEFEEVTIISHTSEEPSVLPENTVYRCASSLRLELTQPLPTPNSRPSFSAECPYLVRLAVALNGVEGCYYHSLYSIKIDGPGEFRPSAVVGVGRKVAFLDRETKIVAPCPAWKTKFESANFLFNWGPNRILVFQLYYPVRCYDSQTSQLLWSTPVNCREFPLTFIKNTPKNLYFRDESKLLKKVTFDGICSDVPSTSDFQDYLPTSKPEGLLKLLRSGDIEVFEETNTSVGSPLQHIWTKLKHPPTPRGTEILGMKRSYWGTLLVCKYSALTLALDVVCPRSLRELDSCSVDIKEMMFVSEFMCRLGKIKRGLNPVLISSGSSIYLFGLTCHQKIFPIHKPLCLGVDFTILSWSEEAHGFAVVSERIDQIARVTIRWF